MCLSGTACELPAGSRLSEVASGRDFLDCFRVDAAISPRKAAEIIADFPSWVRGLLMVRRLITAPFGLSNDGPGDPNSVGIFPVEAESAHEVVAGFDDKHLNFRISVVQRSGVTYLATWVHTHNLGGRLYLALIYPFHVLVVRNALWRVTQAAK